MPSIRTCTIFSAPSRSPALRFLCAFGSSADKILNIGVVAIRIGLRGYTAHHCTSIADLHLRTITNGVVLVSLSNCAGPCSTRHVLLHQTRSYQVEEAGKCKEVRLALELLPDLNSVEVLGRTLDPKHDTLNPKREI